MTRDRAPPRVVLDTNVVLSALVFARGRLSPLRFAWEAGHIQPVISQVTAAEFMRVLSYPKFKLKGPEQQELLADYLPFCVTVRIPKPPPATPSCRDDFDIPFLQLALAGRANALVTGDQDLLTLGDRFACPIISPEAFMQSLKR